MALDQLCGLYRQARRARGRRGPRQGRPRHRRQAPLHLRLDGIAQGRDQHAEDDDLEPGDAEGRQSELPYGRAGAGRLAAVEPHLRRQQQLQSRAVGRRLVLYRRWAAAAGRDRSHRQKPQGRVADHLLQRAQGLRDAAALCRGRRGPAEKPVRPPTGLRLRRRGAGAPRARGVRAAGSRRRSAMSCRS